PLFPYTTLFRSVFTRPLSFAEEIGGLGLEGGQVRAQAPTLLVVEIVRLQVAQHFLGLADAGEHPCRRLALMMLCADRFHDGVEQARGALAGLTIGENHLEIFIKGFFQRSLPCLCALLELVGKKYCPLLSEAAQSLTGHGRRDRIREGKEGAHGSFYRGPPVDQHEARKAPARPLLLGQGCELCLQAAEEALAIGNQGIVPWLL